MHRIECPATGGHGVAPEALPHIDAFVTAAANELERIATWRSIDVVYGPAWDVDVLGAMRATPLPVIAMLATPFLVALRHSGDLGESAPPPHLVGLLQVEREVFDHAHLVHAISGAILDTIATEYGSEIDDERTAVGAIGLRDRGHDVAEQRSDGTTRVLFVGRLEARKGIDDLLCAVAALAPRRPDVVWQIAGGETRPRDVAGREEEFRSRHRGEPWLEKVRFLGSVDDATLDQLYRRADLVVLPSRYESFGLVMLESMMHGRPQVSCRVGGIREVVRDGIDGLLVEPQDPAALADAIAGLLDDPGRRAAMGREARLRYESEFTIDEAARRLERILLRPCSSTSDDRHVRIHDAEEADPLRHDRHDVLVGRRTRVVVAGRTDARQVASLHGSVGAQAVVRTRASLTKTVDLSHGWNALELPRTPDDVVLTWRRGQVVFGGVVTIEDER